ncbi:hypothetical protein KC980_03585, partial [candidate division WWE3 bacterium]|nr:hypothetical protein [candidate division WWE3 bacterium]
INLKNSYKDDRAPIISRVNALSSGRSVSVVVDAYDPSDRVVPNSNFRTSGMFEYFVEVYDSLGYMSSMPRLLSTSGSVTIPVSLTNNSPNQSSIFMLKVYAKDAAGNISTPKEITVNR